MPAIPYLYLPPPSPYGTKPFPAVGINRRDICSAHLVWSWPFTEGHGNYINEVGDPYKRRGQHFGPDTAIGSGVDVPIWTSYEGVLGLKMDGFSNNIQKLAEVYTTPTTPNPPAPHSFRNGITVEVWARDLVQANTNVQFTLMQIGTFNSGNIAELYIFTGQDGRPGYSFSYYGTEVVFTPFAFPDNLLFPDHASLPNHVIASCTPGGYASIYGNGRLLARKQTAVTPFASGGDENTVFVKLGTNTNGQHGNWEGVIYKASVYNRAMGDGTARVLAANPMRVYYPMRLPGKFQLVQPPAGGGGTDTGTSGENPICDQL